MGRDALRLRRAQARREPEQGGDHRALQGQSRRLQGAALRRVRRSAEDEHGEDPEVQAEGDGEGGVTQRYAAITFRTCLRKNCSEFSLALIAPRRRANEKNASFGTPPYFRTAITDSMIFCSSHVFSEIVPSTLPSISRSLLDS